MEMLLNRLTDYKVLLAGYFAALFTLDISKAAGTTMTILICILTVIRIIKMLRDWKKPEREEK